MIHTRELELAARDHSNSHRPDYDLNSRVQAYTNWEGEINEIVHYSKTTARGIDVLVNMAISDYIGDTKNIETMFNPTYKFFGVRVGNHDLYDYCVVVIYAEEIYSSLKSALYTSSNIDNELAEERELLAKNIAQNSNYHYSSHYARENPNVQMHDYMNKGGRSKRKVRLTENGDGERTFTVLRRNSLERNNDYAHHDDVDYQYVDKNNEIFTHVGHYEKKDRSIHLGRGEKIYRQTITDYDKELYSKNVDTTGERFTKHGLSGDPYSQRFTVGSHRDIDTKLYYGDLNDVTIREEKLVSSYPTVKPEHTFGVSSVAKGRRTTYGQDKYFDNVDNARTFRNTAHIPRKRVDRRIYAPLIDDSELNSHQSNYESKSISNARIDDGIEVTYEEQPVYENREFDVVQHHSYGGGQARQSVVQDMAVVGDPPRSRRETTFVESHAQPISNYRMTERTSVRHQPEERATLSPINGNGVTVIKDRKYDIDSPRTSPSKMKTAFTSGGKKASEEIFDRDDGRLNSLNLSDSF